MKTQNKNVIDLTEEIPQNIEKPTIPGAFHGKMVKYIEEHSLKELLQLLGKSLLCVLIFVGLRNGETLQVFIFQLAIWNNSILVHIFWSCFLVFGFAYFKRFVGYIRDQLQVIFDRGVVVESSGPAIEGIPTAELIDFLLTMKKFGDFQKTFGISRALHDDFARHLEKLGVLVRGENYSRILNPAVGERELIRIFESVEHIDELSTIELLAGEEQSPTLFKIRSIIPGK